MTTQGQCVFQGVDIIATQEVGKETYEVCATCEAAFDEKESKLSVELHAFVRRFEIRGKDDVLQPPWLPRPETVRMGVDRGEARDAAKEVFANWVRRVRISIPPATEWMRHPVWLQTAKEHDEDR